MANESPWIRAVQVPAFLAIPNLVHGFERRLMPTGAESREESRMRVGRTLAPVGQLHFLHQTHGTVVREAPWEGRPEGDASFAHGPRLLLGIETADCLPLLFVDRMQHLTAAAHAGWRGTAAGIAVRALRALESLGSRPENVQVALGPGIGVCCYEVGDELKSAFGEIADHVFHPGSAGRLHLDLRRANTLMLLSAGVVPEHIHHVAECTYCSEGLYHSYRRDGNNGGRMISWVGFRGEEVVGSRSGLE